jgi:periplasmic copper chaperone A
MSSPVAAHIDPDPKEAQAGSELSVGFTVEHGCEGSPTTSLDMRLPDGVTNAVPEPPEGWNGSIADNVVTFTGGPLPDAEEMTFNVRMTLPPTPDSTIYFPFVQRCEVGEIRWIEVPTDESGEELDEPAPAMQLIGPLATPVTTALASQPDAPVTTVASTPPSDGATADTVATATPTTEAVVTETTRPDATATSTTLTLGSVPVDSNATDDGSSSTTVAVIVGAVLFAAAAAGIVILARRRRS